MVLAVVVAASLRIPVYEFDYTVSDGISMARPDPHTIAAYWVRDPGAVDILCRLAWAGPLSIVATLGVLWSFRRLKSRDPL